MPSPPIQWSNSIFQKETFISSDHPRTSKDTQHPKQMLSYPHHTGTAPPPKHSYTVFFSSWMSSYWQQFIKPSYCRLNSTQCSSEWVGPYLTFPCPSPNIHGQPFYPSLLNKYYISEFVLFCANLQSSLFYKVFNTIRQLRNFLRLTSTYGAQQSYSGISRF